MNATPGPILPKICDLMTKIKTMKAIPDLKLLGIVFNFLHFVIELEQFTLP